MLCLAPILAAFRQAHPGVTLDVHSDERYADLVDDRLDVALRIGQLADSALHVRRIGRIGMGMFCAPTILDARERHDLAKVSQLTRLVNRKSVGRGKSVTVRVDTAVGGRIKKK